MYENFKNAVGSGWVCMAEIIFSEKDHTMSISGI